MGWGRAVGEGGAAGSLPATIEAPAKLTLSLRVTGVRPDGYHLIDAEMVSLDLDRPVGPVDRRWTGGRGRGRPSDSPGPGQPGEPGS